MQHSLALKDGSDGDERQAHGPQVSFDFPADAKHVNGLALIGEAPGAEETRLGHPFVGRSGQLLDKVLAKAEIDRKQTLIGNVFRHQPPGNKVDHFFLSRRQSKLQNVAIAEEYGQFGSNFVRQEFAGELSHLRDTLAAYQKKNSGHLVVMALGRTPFWALTGENGLLSRVGQVLPCRLLPSVKVIPTYHPSFILRGNWGLQDEWCGHFVAALKLV
jgi:uracil-DNA glycosylase